MHGFRFDTVTVYIVHHLFEYIPIINCGVKDLLNLWFSVHLIFENIIKHGAKIFFVVCLFYFSRNFQVFWNGKNIFSVWHLDSHLKIDVLLEFYIIQISSKLFFRDRTRCYYYWEFTYWYCHNSHWWGSKQLAILLLSDTQEYSMLKFQETFITILLVLTF